MLWSKIMSENSSFISREILAKVCSKAKQNDITAAAAVVVATTVTDIAYVARRQDDMFIRQSTVLR